MSVTLIVTNRGVVLVAAGGSPADCCAAPRCHLCILENCRYTVDCSHNSCLLFFHDYQLGPLNEAVSALVRYDYYICLQ